MKHLITLLFACSFILTAQAYKDTQSTGKKSKNLDGIAANCPAPRTSSQLDINNVRTLIHTAGDFWRELGQDAAYEVPSGSGLTSIYAGALW